MAMVSSAARRRLLRLFSTITTTSTSPTLPVVVDPATVRRLARAGRFSEISSLLEPLKSDPRFSTNEPFAASLSIAYATAGMVDAAVDTLRSFPSQPTALFLNALLSALNRHPSLHRRVPDLLSSLTNSLSISPNDNSYGILIKSHCLSGNSTSAMNLLEEIENKGSQPTIVMYTTILDSLYKEKKPREAEQLWNEMMTKNLTPDLAAHNVRVMNRAQIGTPESVLKLIGEIEASGLKPDAITYNYLMSCYCRHRRFDEAKEVYRSLEKKGCVPNVKTFNDFMHALCKSGNFDAAAEVCIDAINQGKLLYRRSTKLLLDGLVKKGRVRTAKRLITKIRHECPRNFVGGWKELEKQLGLIGDDHGEELLPA